MNYVFYDFETSGLDTKFDQPIQIAAILVDDNFNVIDDPINEVCRLKDGVIPNPSALVVTKVDINILKNGQSFYEMMTNIHDKFSKWSPATFIGYNSIRFDEEVLRSSFFQSLYDPYLTNTNSNTRTDLFKIVLGSAALKINILKFPINDKNNRISFKLENIARANGINVEQAHDALSDVETTIAIAKIIKDNDPEYWNECMKIMTPNTLMTYLENGKYHFAAPEHVASNSIMKPLSFLTCNPNNVKELAFFDLNYDVNKYSDYRSSAIVSMIESKQRIVKTLQSNKSPIILNSDFIEAREIFTKDDLTMFEERHKDISDNQNFIENLDQALVDRFDDYQLSWSQPSFLEEQIYNGEFYSSDDKGKILNFRSCESPSKRYAISKDLKDKRLREICYRILFAESPDILPNNILSDRKQFIADKVFSTEEKVRWCTLEKAKNDLESIKSSDRFIKDKEYIKKIEDFITSEEDRYKSYLIS